MSPNTRAGTLKWTACRSISLHPSLSGCACLRLVLDIGGLSQLDEYVDVVAKQAIMRHVLDPTGRRVHMGRLTYDSTLTADFDDRVLAHLQVVIGAKLRRGESFQFSWRDDPATGEGRSSLWMDQSVPLAFKYYGSRAPVLNPAWVEALMLAANSVSGLRIVPEPEDSKASQ